MALTTIPATGAKIRGSTFSNLITELRPLRARMASDQALTASSTTLQNVTELLVPVAANCTYDGILVAASILAAGSTEDVKYGFTFPTGATCDYFNIGPATSVTTANGDGEFAARLAATSGTTANNFGNYSSLPTNAVIQISLITGANAGNLQVQAAQNTSGVNVVTVKAGSKLILYRTA